MKTSEKIQLIIESVAHEYELEPMDLIKRNRTASVAQARSLAMAICYERTNATLAEVGSIFGNRDHSAVSHSMKLRMQRQKANEVEETLIQKLKQYEPQQTTTSRKAHS